MCIHVFNPAYEFVQVIPEWAGGLNGYTGMEAQADVDKGFAGAEFTIPTRPLSVASRILPGYYCEWWKNGRQVYAGHVVGKKDMGESWRITLLGSVAVWMKRKRVTSTAINKKASEIVVIMQGTISAAAGIIDATDARYIEATTYVVTTGQTWLSPGASVADPIDFYNKYEGYEFGGFFATPGVSLSQKTQLYYREPDLTTMHYQVNAADLAERPELEPDMDNFGNQVLVYYGTSATTTTVNGTATSQADHGIHVHEIDISGNGNTTAADAAQVAAAYLNGLKVDGVERPSISTEIVLTPASRLKAINGAQRDLYSIQPGQNIMVTGLANVPRLLTTTNAETFFHIQTTKKNQDGTVTLSVGKPYDPAVLLARLKEAA